MDTKQNNRDILDTLTATTGTGPGLDPRLEAAAQSEVEKMILARKQAYLDGVIARFECIWEAINELVNQVLESFRLLFEVDAGPPGRGGAILFKPNHVPTTNPAPGPGRRAREPPQTSKTML